MPLGFTPLPPHSHPCSEARSKPHLDLGLDSNRTGLASNQRAAKDRELAALMRAAQDGDKVAYVGLLRELLPLAQRIVFAKLPYLQPADRDDVVQEVLVSLHTARATYDPRRPFVPWLMAIAHHRIVDRVRRNARLSAHEVLVDEFPEMHVPEEPDPAENSYGDPEGLRRAIKSLPAGQRVATELLKIRELSLTEAAKVTGLSMGALKISAHRAIRNLRRSLASFNEPKKSIDHIDRRSHLRTLSTRGANSAHTLSGGAQRLLEGSRRSLRPVPQDETFGDGSSSQIRGGHARALTKRVRPG